MDTGPEAPRVARRVSGPNAWAPTTEGERLGGPTTAVMLGAIDAFADDLGPDPTLVRQILIAWETQGRPS